MSLSNEEILNAIAEKSVMDIVELISAMEEKFGVSAQAAVAVSAAPSAGADGGEQQAEEKTEFDVQKLHDSVRLCIKYVLSGIQNTNYPIPHSEMDSILLEYYKLIHGNNDKPIAKINAPWGHYVWKILAILALLALSYFLWKTYALIHLYQQNSHQFCQLILP